MVKFDHEAFRERLLETLSANAGALWDQRLALLDLESAEGWTCFHAQALWIRANVPPPFLNDLGRCDAVEQLKVKLWAPGDDEFPYSRQGWPSGYQSDFLSDLLDKPLPWANYRNFVEPGDITPDGSESSCFDAAVAGVVAALRSQGRNAFHEIARDREAGWQDALQRGVHTPAPMLIERLPEDPLARHGLPKRVSESTALSTPDCTLALMQQLAPDFAHASTLSSKKSLLFLKPIDDRLAWAVAVERGGRGNQFRFPPSPALALVWRKDPTGRRAPALIYRDVLGGFHGLGAASAREIELQLTYHLQRFRRLIAFYEPFVSSALQAA
jgi:hypothetical protein